MARIASRSVTVRGRVGPRRKTRWASDDIPTGLTTLAAATAVLDQSISIGTAFGSDPVTIVRTRGNLWVQSDQTANSETPFGALGMIIVSDQAAAISSP